MRAIAEPARETPVFGEFDVVVLGGGPAGIAAGTAAAHGGAKTLLVERYGFLGGMGTAAGVTNFCGLHANVHGEHVRVVRGVADELLDRVAALDGLNEPHLVFGRILAQAYDTAAFKCAADQMLLGAGANALFHATAVGVVRDGAGGGAARGAARGGWPAVPRPASLVRDVAHHRSTSFSGSWATSRRPPRSTCTRTRRATSRTGSGRPSGARQEKTARMPRRCLSIFKSRSRTMRAMEKIRCDLLKLYGYVEWRVGTTPVGG